MFDGQFIESYEEANFQVFRGLAVVDRDIENLVTKILSQDDQMQAQGLWRKINITSCFIKNSGSLIGLYIEADT
jgi:hypothetical protein